MVGRPCDPGPALGPTTANRLNIVFDLEKALATWRSATERRRVYSDDDLEELEAHLRDVTDRFQRDGLTEEEAFRAAIQRMGDPFHMEDEY